MDTHPSRQDEYRAVLSELDEASRRLRSSENAREEYQTRRTAAVLQLSRFGVPRSVVAKLTGLTRGRVQQLLDAAGATGIGGDEWERDPLLRRLVHDAIADLPLPSLGVGVRRESLLGPHLGAGIGGSWRLTGDVDHDRASVILGLEQVIDRVRDGDLDHLIELTPEEVDLVRGRLIES